MKNIFTILVLLLIECSVFGQKVPISFVNNQRNEYDTNNPYDYDERISQITLISETEFEFRCYPLERSCRSWRRYNGTWDKKKDTIVFSVQYEITEKDVRFSFSNRVLNRYYHLDFNTDQDSKLTNKKIEIQFVYDIDSDLDGIELNMKLEKDNSLKIPFEDIPNRNELASIRCEYFLPNGEKRIGYITENQGINLKESELPNYIEVTFIEQPKKKIIYRVTKGIIKDDNLKIISTDKTKSDLPDFFPVLTFKDGYNIYKE